MTNKFFIPRIIFVSTLIIQGCSVIRYIYLYELPIQLNSPLFISMIFNLILLHGSFVKFDKEKFYKLQLIGKIDKYWEYIINLLAYSFISITSFIIGLIPKNLGGKGIRSQDILIFFGIN